MLKAVAGIIVNKNKILIGKKVLKEGHFLSGGWHIPGGHMIQGESDEQALKREMKEETNLEINVIKRIVRHRLMENGVVLSWYLCEPKTIDLKAGGDLSEVKYVNKNSAIKFCDTRATKLWPAEVLKFFEIV